MAHNPVFHTQTKHIEVHYHFIRERILADDVDLLRIDTNLQIANIFTKALILQCCSVIHTLREKRMGYPIE